MKLRKFQCLLYTLVFCLVLCGSAFAEDTKDLIAWSNNPAPVSSDPANTLDYIDPGNPNQASDVAMLECRLVDDHHLEVTIGPNPGQKGGAYPGYQASVTAKIVNVTNDQVKITNVVTSDQPEAILLGITDLAGNNLIGKVLNANESIQVKVITRVKQSAAQLNTYRFSVRIDAVQETSPPINPPGGGGGGDSGLILINEPSERVEIPSNPETLSPPQEEPVELTPPPVALSKLPYTGGNVALFVGIGLTLGCIGVFLRRRQ